MESVEWQRLMTLVVEQAAEPPYKIFKVGSQWVVKNNAGQTKARFATRAQALKYQRTLYVSVPGAARRAANTPWTGKAPLPPKAK